MTSIPKLIRIATRESRLALTQTGMVADALRARHPGMEVQVVGMTTRGDQVLDRPLSQVGGKGLFVKELEVALDDGRADIAVHSMKDVPMELPPQFALCTFGEREVPLDAFVSARFARVEDLPPGSRVGTSSLRRECQLRRAFPHLAIHALRGNVNTRLAKLDRGEYDAIILAAAGLTRLGLGERIRCTLPETLTLPAIGQGILGIEHRRDRPDLAEVMKGFEHADTASAAWAERAVGRVVEGSCEVPVGAFARVHGERLAVEAFVGLPDGSKVVRQRVEGLSADAEAVGREAGSRLLEAGGREVLRELHALK